MDYQLFKAINNFSAAHDGVEDLLKAYVQASEIIFAAGLVALFLAWRPDARRAIVAAALSAGLGLLAAHFLSVGVDRMRPFVDHPSAHLFIAHAKDPGFPSDHATAAFAIGFALVLRHRRMGILALGLALVLAVGRVALGVHYPADVGAGALLGLAAALALWPQPIRARVDQLADAVGQAPLLRTILRSA
jgi:undecaprenyl-diphosphatase